MNGTARKMMRRYVTAKGRASAGVPMRCNIASQQKKPMAAITADVLVKNVALVPITRLAYVTSFRPRAWPTKIVVAIPKPNIALMRKNKIALAFDEAVSADSPRKRPIHIALIEPLSD